MWYERNNKILFDTQIKTYLLVTFYACNKAICDNMYTYYIILVIILK